ncbi:MAG: pyruvate kinase [Deltaproteobacteria bacterium]|nr:pyruvate kinase [Deltaproteobacteria bacterium]MBW2305810.1 pyruvate kinase [Deltaproteobacteria bacterium]
MTGSMRHVDIIATLGPSTESDGLIKEIALAGVDGCRINLSHADADQARELVAAVRRVGRQLGKKIFVLLDLKGRKMRLGRFQGPVELCAGQHFVLTADEVQGGVDRASVSDPDLCTSISSGDTIFLSDRRVELLVEKVRGADICCRVRVGGTVDTGKGINIPSLLGRPVPLTMKDRKDLDLGIELGVDQIYLSFVRGPHDVRNAGEYLAQRGAHIPLWPKIENAQAVDAVEAIMKVSDGICVARGDLGTELPPEELPLAQKRILGLCRRLRIPCSMGGQVMDSMTRNPVPLRAEICDVANAVLDGADAIILSDETSVGRHPALTVKYVRRIADRAAHYGYSESSA